MSYRGVGHVIFNNLHLGVGHAVLRQMEGVGHVLSNHHILKCSAPTPPPVLFDQSLRDRFYTSVLIPAYDLIDGSYFECFYRCPLGVKEPTLWFGHLEKLNRNFSIASFVIRVNLLRP